MKNEPSLGETIAVFSFSLAIELFVLIRNAALWKKSSGWLDNQSYAALTSMILSWKVTPDVVRDQHFWGLPYVAAVFFRLGVAPQPVAIQLISLLSAFGGCVLIHRMYGAWVAMAFGIVSIEWIQMALLGGSEPLFTFLLLLAFLAARQDCWVLGALVASLASTVRPVGVLAVLALLIILIRNRRWRTLSSALAVTFAIAAAYLVAVYALFREPFRNVRLYGTIDWGPYRFPLGIPLRALLSSMWSFIDEGRWQEWVPALIGICAILLWTGAVLLSPKKRMSFAAQPAEGLFLALYTTFFLSYTYDGVAWYFMRFMLPVLPILLFAVRDWIPRKRWIIWSGAALVGLLATFEVIGVRPIISAFTGIRL